MMSAEGVPVLHSAVQKRLTKIVSLLLKKGADPNLQDTKFGRTALHNAVEMGLTKIAEAMISHNASPLIKDFHGSTALDLAQEKDM
jgi:ankyrin repeat protein